MSTRAYICIQKENKLLGIYCHMNGYLTYTGSILFDYYQNEQKIKQLINLGDLLIIKPKLYPNKKSTHTFQNPQIGISLFYGRDNNQNNHLKIINLNTIYQQFWIEHLYYYAKDHKWYYLENKKHQKPILLEEALNNYYEELGFQRTIGFYGKYTLEEISYYKKQEELKNNLLKILKKDQ